MATGGGSGSESRSDLERLDCENQGDTEPVWAGSKLGGGAAFEAARRAGSRLVGPASVANKGSG